MASASPSINSYRTSAPLAIPVSAKQMEHFTEVAGKVAFALREPKDTEPLETQITRFLQHFVAFAQYGKRQPVAEVDKIDRAFLYTDLSDDVRMEYLNLCGYTVNGVSIVELK